ncbi:epoxide hydrolase family protein [Curtobacterium sp. MCJR17_020]|uniref:epoxide hydrolase family protein n=1 Tax=Curtobacterium sp. MCJR17_020 TaxID=2175619 RepID=UPI000DA6ECBE|nr:epoxide hydrolase family protein [Curtobacterium sp. MCJR17_020]WIE74131.1 epoxide hydrolase [Curtobacterium sp. MCJR17_020]
MTSVPFAFRVPEEEVGDLRRRVDTTRWATPIGASGWDAGTDPSELRRLAAHWASAFDWRAQEAMINALPSFITDIGGTAVYYLRFDAVATSPGDAELPPLVLTHGWPSTFLELVDLARRLSDPATFGYPTRPAFTVIVPSLPGFTFTPARPTFPADLPTHELWHRLMRDELGFERYGAHGGDLGAGVTSRLGEAHPESVVGIHLLAVSGPADYDSESLDDAERSHLAAIARWTAAEGGYQHQQQTRPMSLAPALADSPVGLLAWIVEKYRAWSDSEGQLSSRFSDEFILTQASLYWFTNTISTSFRPYFEHGQGLSVPVRRVDVPTAVAVFPADLSRPPRQWVERTYALQRFTEMPRGGHFAAHEEPELLAADIHAFFVALQRSDG